MTMNPHLAEINTTPGDFEGNFNRIVEAILKGESNNCNIIVFPELTICGYLVRDLLYLDGFIESNLEYLDKIKSWIKSHDIKAVVVIGYADYCHKEYGKPFKNMAAVIRNGITLATYQKQLLPFYDVFDEPRYFEPGTELCKIEIDGVMCGITICEDLWNDKGQEDYNYNNNPVQRYLSHGVKTIINLSSSPWHQDKVEKRIKMAKEISSSCQLIYVNQIGGQDELVFDGNSMLAMNGAVINQLRHGQSTSHYFDPNSKIRELTDNLIIGLTDYVHKTGHTEVVVNSSGGIDSAVVIALAAKAFGGDKVHCIMMPSKYSSPGSVNDAKALHKKFQCKEYIINVDHDPILEIVGKEFNKNNIKPHPVAEENVQARMRGMMGAMYFSNAFGAMPLTTGNKTELALGYCTLYGDMSGGFNPIGDLYKDEVYAVAKFLGVPGEIINKVPSAELAPGQTDEASLLPYVFLNSIVKAFIEEYISSYNNWCKYAFEDEKTKDIFDKVNIFAKVTEADYNRMIKKIKLNEFKRRQAAPCIKVSKVAFGMGRRMPLIGKY